MKRETYTVTSRKHLFQVPGTELLISPLLSGLRNLNAEKIQWYLSSELRNRILSSGTKIRIIDRLSRKEYLVEPQKYEGRKLSEIPLTIQSGIGEIHCEIYQDEVASNRRVALLKLGTRVLESINDLEILDSKVWASGYFQGFVDCPFISLTPGTRQGIIHDEAYGHLIETLKEVEKRLAEILATQNVVEEEKTNLETFNSLKKAFREAILALPPEEYNWFDLHKKQKKIENLNAIHDPSPTETLAEEGLGSNIDKKDEQKQFFDYPGPLFSASIVPRSSIIPVNSKRHLSAVGRDKRRKRVEENLTFEWKLAEGIGTLDGNDKEITTFEAPAEPGLSNVLVRISQGDIVTEASAVITVTDTISNSEPKEDSTGSTKGLPSYTFKNAPGELWRSQFDERENLIYINSGHKDFLFASKSRSARLRYLCRLYSKELILINFPGQSASSLLERLVELALYTEENLK